MQILANYESRVEAVTVTSKLLGKLFSAIHRYVSNVKLKKRKLWYSL